MKKLPRSIFQRLFGISATKPPADPGCWSLADDRITIHLSRAPELGGPGGAIRLEGGQLGERVLVIHGDDGAYHAFRNRCRHMGRRLDPVPETSSVQCCSVNHATYAYDGKVLDGPAKGPVSTYRVKAENGKLYVSLSES